MKKKFKPTFYILKEKSNINLEKEIKNDNFKSRNSIETSEELEKKIDHSKNLSILKSLVIKEESKYFSEKVLESYHQSNPNLYISHFETKKNLIRENLYKVAAIQKIKKEKIRNSNKNLKPKKKK